MNTLTNNKYRILLSAPSDVKKEKKIAKEVIEELNGYLDGVSLELLGFNISTYSSANGDDPQDILNKQFKDIYDIYIGILWKKFGTPTKRDESGTIEEFNIAYARFKKNKLLMKIGFYFNTKISNLNEVDTIELEKIREFKNKFQTNEYSVLYLEYNNYKHFERMFRSNIAIFVNQLNKVKESRNQYLTIEKNVIKEFECFYNNAKQFDQINKELSDSFDKIFGELNLYGIKDVRTLNAVIIRISKGANELKKIVDKFDVLMKKLFNNIAYIVIYYNLLENSEIKSEIFASFKREFAILIEKYETYISVFSIQHEAFNNLEGNYSLMKSFKSNYLSVIRDLTNNFTSYVIVIKTYSDFTDKILNIKFE